MSRLPSIPRYRLHKPSGQGVVTVRLADGSRKDIYLGKYNSDESRKEYARVVAELSVTTSPARLTSTRSPDITVNEVLLAFYRHAEEHYRRVDGTTTQELVEYRQTFKPVRELHGHTPAAEFGPRALKAVRQKMLDAGLCRSTINNRVRRLRHVFKWGAGEELVPVTVYQALAAVAGLQRGRTTAREPEPVEPVTEEHVVAVLPYLRPVVRGMVEVQLLTGMRPGEVVTIRPGDIDTAEPVWVYRPPHHKNTHRGKARAVAIGPKAQAILTGFAPADSEGYYFSPRRAVEQQVAERSESRLTPRYPAHMIRNLTKRVRFPKRVPADHYTAMTYARAVARGITLANRAGSRKATETGAQFTPIPSWSPNQLRHTHGTKVRRRYGLEAAQVVLGHEKADVTQVYAEKNLALAATVAAEIG